MLRQLERFFFGDTASSHINPNKFDLRHAKLLDVLESRVFKVSGEKVLKIYDTPFSQGIITLSTLKQYKELTHQVSIELASRADAWTVLGKSIPIIWKVIEIEDLGEWPETKDVWSIGQFVPGTNLRDIYYPHRALHKVFPPAELNGQLGQMSCLIDQVSLEVNTKLGTNLTDIDLSNVIPNVSNTSLLLNVTDVCGIVSKVDDGYKNVPVMIG